MNESVIETRGITHASQDQVFDDICLTPHRNISCRAAEKWRMRFYLQNKIGAKLETRTDAPPQKTRKLLERIGDYSVNFLLVIKTLNTDSLKF